MTESEKKILERIVQSRKKGLHSQSFQELNRLLTTNKDEGYVLAEGIIQALLNHQKEIAKDLYGLLSRLPDAGKYLDNHFLLRWRLEFPEKQYSIQMPDMSGCTAKWTEEFLKRGEDRLCPVEIDYCEMTSPYGAVKFDFIVTCWSCNAKFHLFVYQNILVYRECYCPACFARVFLSYDQICQFLNKKIKAGEDLRDVRRIDEELIQMYYEQETDIFHSGESLLFTQSSGMEYLSLLSQFIINRSFFAGEVEK